MQWYRNPARETWKEIIQRPVVDQQLLEKSIRRILRKVKERGDKAVRRYNKEFDAVSIKKLQVTQKEIDVAATLLDEELKAAIIRAKENIETFHRAQQEEVKKVETMPGVLCWRQPVPVERIGIYIPGGSAPLFSTVLMLGVPAMIAGCKEVVLVTPPGKDERSAIHPAILFAAQLCGIQTIFKTGGAQAIAALAYGTETIPAVSKIFGPGNQYVTMAKQIVQQEGTAIDMPAGPSEVLVIADDTAIPDYVAADLLSQAEHGPDSQVILIATSDHIAAKVAACIQTQVEDLPRSEIAKRALEQSKVIVMESLEDAVELSNRYAPEHLIISCADAIALAGKVTAAGSVFLGNYSPESAGDYASGTNHVLPTNGFASVYAGVSLDSFIKKITYQQITRQGLEQLGPVVMQMAKAEGLEAHSRAVAIRLTK